MRRWSAGVFCLVAGAYAQQQPEFRATYPIRV
jgi:hypothetical protein